ncbi:MAG: FAD-dependent oxidoreductase [Nannocystaceae bacterium]|nr:FAD-dependent oxidoreductase [Myxococcales bacterium]
MTTRSALILGAGVSGLTTAVRLLDAGFSVRVWGKDLPPATTSNVAAAFWYPYQVEPPDRVARWAADSFAVFETLAAQPETGVVRRLAIEIGPPRDRPAWSRVLADYRDAAPDELPPGRARGSAFTSFVIETPRYLPWLIGQIQARGGVVERRAVDDLDAAARAADLVVVCAGLGAAALARDAELSPLRGQLVRVANPGLTRVVVDEEGPEITYIVPRRDDCVLGGSAEPGCYDTAADPALTRAILARCVAIEPRLRGATLLGVDVGLRPCRTSVRLERAADAPARIYNYGHGGAGVTLSWGCAAEVRELAARACPP